MANGIEREPAGALGGIVAEELGHVGVPELVARQRQHQGDQQQRHEQILALGDESEHALQHVENVAVFDGDLAP